MKRRTMTSAVAVLSVFLLAACETSEERAEKHFQSGLELLEAGDVDRAIVEFRNVFQLDQNHQGARLAFAGVMMDQGRPVEAFRQYLNVVEQSPEDYESQLALAEIATLMQNWETVERHYAPAVEGLPDEPRVQAVGIALDYRAALLDESTEARSAARDAAIALIPQLPDSIILHRVLVDAYARDGNEEAALETLNKAIELEPDNRQLYTVRLQLLAQRGDADAIEAQLLEMIGLFPEDQNLEPTLLRFYMSQERLDDAEAFLRDRVDPTGESIQPYVELVQFLSQVRGRDVALEELDAAISASPDQRVLKGLRAGLLFDLGRRDESIAAMEAALDGAEPSEETDRLRVGLARMLIADGNDVGARRAVEQVLNHDPTQIDALKLSAAWEIERDNPDAAINSLRIVLDQSPQDAEAMTLMAQAHQRNGSRELAREMLALAAEASNNAPAESIRYAALLRSEDNARTAEDILITSLRLNPDNIALLSELGALYAETEDWARAEQVVGTLRRLETEAATNAADGLQVAIFTGQDRTDETVNFLEQLSQGDDQAVAARIAIARAHLASGDVDAAVASAEASVAEQPDSLALRFALGAVYAASGDLEGAEREYRAILDVNNRAERVWLELIRLLNAQGKRDEALAALDQGLGAIPNAPNLLWARASVLEQAGNFEGAIAVYEDLYAADSNSLVIANNLASLITTYRTDEESLERAYAVARRLRGTEVPAFQDTYGWIAYRRGDFDEALDHLEPAAQALSNDPLVQYHLAMTYLALGQNDQALEQFRTAVSLAGETDTRPQFAEARDQIRSLESGASE